MCSGVSSKVMEGFAGGGVGGDRGVTYPRRVENLILISAGESRLVSALMLVLAHPDAGQHSRILTARIASVTTFGLVGAVALGNWRLALFIYYDI